MGYSLEGGILIEHQCSDQIVEVARMQAISWLIKLVNHVEWSRCVDPSLVTRREL